MECRKRDVTKWEMKRSHLKCGTRRQGWGDRVDTSFLSSEDKGNQESQTVMSGDTILGRELRSLSRESLQMYLSRYVLLLQRSFYKYNIEMKQKYLSTRLYLELCVDNSEHLLILDILASCLKQGVSISFTLIWQQDSGTKSLKSSMLSEQQQRL